MRTRYSAYGNLALLTGLLLAPPDPIRPPKQQVDDRITLGPGLFTYSALARSLSVRGRTVVADTPTGSRAAFICLRNRSWTDVSRLITSGLGMRLRPEKPDQWVLEADPEEAAREKSWLQGYVSNLRKDLAELLQFARTTEAQSPRDLDRKIRELMSQCNHTMLRLNEAHQEGSAAFRDAVHLRNLAMRLLCPGALVFARLPGVPDLGALTATAVIDGSAVAPLAQGLMPGEALVSQLEPRVQDLLRGSDPMVLCVLDFRDDAGMMPSLIVWIAYCTADGNWWFQLGAAVGQPSGVGELFGASGPDPLVIAPGAVRWLEHERAATQEFAQSADARKSFVIRSSLPITSLSQVVQAWASTDDREAVIELAPVREYVNNLRADEASPQWQSGYTTNLASVFAEAPFGGARPWSAYLDSGVLIVKNRLAFLDHRRDIPFAPLLQLLHDSEASPTKDRMGAVEPPFEASRRCAIAMGPRGVPWFGRLLVYRGVSIAFVGDVLVLGNVWEAARRKLTDAQRSDLMSGRTVHIPLEHVVGPSDRLALARSLRRLGLYCPLSHRPDFQEILRRSVLAILYKSRRPDLGRATIDMRLENPGSEVRGMPIYKGILGQVPLAGRASAWTP